MFLSLFILFFFLTTIHSQKDKLHYDPRYTHTPNVCGNEYTFPFNDIEKQVSPNDIYLHCILILFPFLMCKLCMRVYMTMSVCVTGSWFKIYFSLKATVKNVWKLLSWAPLSSMTPAVQAAGCLWVSKTQINWLFFLGFKAWETLCLSAQLSWARECGQDGVKKAGTARVWEVQLRNKEGVCLKGCQHRLIHRL